MSPPLWFIGVFSLLLIVPLIDLPRPTLITAPPWKVELLVSLALLAGTLLVGRMAIYANSSSPLYKWAVKLALLFTAWSGMSVLWSQSYGPVVHHTLAWAVYLVLLSLMVKACFDGGGVRPIIVSATFLSTILGVICLLDYLSIVDFTSSAGPLRIRWSKYAELLITVAPLLWAAAIYVKGRSRILLWTAASLGWTTAMLSLSKAAFVSGIIGFALFFLGVLIFSKPNLRTKTLKTAAAWLLLTIAVQAAFSLFSTVPSTTQFITGSADTTRESSDMRLFTWKVTAAMIAEDPLLGIGADNFGIAFNEGRKKYAAANPGDAAASIGEDYIFERAHNEYLQVFAELGVVGFALFAGAFLFFGVWVLNALIRNRRRVSPLAIGALAGMSAFAVSSLFTSFSFRAFQNGIAFFAMMAVACYCVLRLDRRSPSLRSADNPSLRIFSVAAVGALAAYSLLVGSSQVLTTVAERLPEPTIAANYFAKALTLYPENGGAQLAYASLMSSQFRYSEAANLVEASISNGTGASVSYAQLSEYQAKAGNRDAAIQALRDGVAVFPRSIYLRARLAVLLEDSGFPSEATAEMDVARAFDLKDANGWYTLIRHGSLKAYRISLTDKTVSGPAELLPQGAVIQYLDEPVGPSK